LIPKQLSPEELTSLARSPTHRKVWVPEDEKGWRMCIVLGKEDGDKLQNFNKDKVHLWVKDFNDGQVSISCLTTLQFCFNS
jgi:hypothetical protein